MEHQNGSTQGDHSTSRANVPAAPSRSQFVSVFIGPFGLRSMPARMAPQPLIQLSLREKWTSTEPDRIRPDLIPAFAPGSRVSFFYNFSNNTPFLEARKLSNPNRFATRLFLMESHIARSELSSEVALAIQRIYFLQRRFTRALPKAPLPFLDARTFEDVAGCQAL